MGAAQGELTTQLTAAAATAGCGTSLATCATSAANVNPYAPSASNNAVYAARMTYGLPTTKAAPELTDTLGQDATILLATVFGGNSAATKSLLGQLGLTKGMYGNLSTSAIQQIIGNTESAQLAAFAGAQLSYWSRINLNAAIGYFSNVTGTLNTAAGDTLTTAVTIGSGGVVNVTGLLTIEAALTENAGGALGFVLGGLTPQTGYGQIDVSGAVVLDGQVDLTLGAGFDLKTGEIFDLVAASGTVTENISALFFDGSACASLGGGAYACADGGRSITLDVFSSGPGGGFDVKVGAVPEPSTWALTLTGLAGLGFAGCRARRKTAIVAA
jgi:hypothetical protein